MVRENWLAYCPEETAASTASTAVVRAAWSSQCRLAAASPKEPWTCAAGAVASLSAGVAIGPILPAHNGAPQKTKRLPRPPGHRATVFQVAGIRDVSSSCIAPADDTSSWGDWPAAAWARCT